jgi:hypothetical protein
MLPETLVVLMNATQLGEETADLGSDVRISRKVLAHR